VHSAAVSNGSCFQGDQQLQYLHVLHHLTSHYVQLKACQPSLQVVCALTKLAREVTAPYSTLWKHWISGFTHKKVSSEITYDPAKYRYNHFFAALLIQEHWRRKHKGTSVNEQLGSKSSRIQADFWAQLIHDSSAAGKATNQKAIVDRYNTLQLKYWQALCRGREAELRAGATCEVRWHARGLNRVMPSNEPAAAFTLSTRVTPLQNESA
jgi:hypothetical protein